MYLELLMLLIVVRAGKHGMVFIQVELVYLDPYVRLLWGAVNLNTNQRKFLNGCRLTLRLLTRIVEIDWTLSKGKP
jgi:hypothetical protein